MQLTLVYNTYRPIIRFRGFRGTFNFHKLSHNVASEGCHISYAACLLTRNIHCFKKRFYLKRNQIFIFVTVFI